MLCDPNTHSISTPHGPISQEWVQEVELVPVEAHHVDEVEAAVAVVEAEAEVVQEEGQGGQGEDPGAVEVLEVVVVEVAAHHDLRGQDLTAHA